MAELFAEHGLEGLLRALRVEEPEEAYIVGHGEDGAEVIDDPDDVEDLDYNMIRIEDDELGAVYRPGDTPRNTTFYEP